MLSSGHRKELLVIMFASSLLTVSKDDSVDEDETLIVPSNKSYKANKRINRRLVQLKKDMDKYIKDIMDMDTANWIKSHSPTKTARALKSSVDEELYSLEFLAVWVLYANFVDRKLPLHESMNFLKEFDYMTLADLLESTNVGKLNGEMFMTAYDIVEALKG